MEKRNNLTYNKFIENMCIDNYAEAAKELDTIVKAKLQDLIQIEYKRQETLNK